MPGLVVAAGAPGAAALVRRAAAPLLRRPWHTLSLRSCPSGQACLGFAGESGGTAVDEDRGILAALDGEVYEPGMATGDEAAAELLRRYAREGAELAPPHGSFAAAIWDRGSARLTLLTSDGGARPLYVTRGSDRVLAAGELKALVAAGLRPELDLQAWAELLAYEHTLCGRSPFADVSLLAAGTTVTIEASHRDERRRWLYALRPAEGSGEDEEELALELERRLRTAVAARWQGRTALALSGGLDSRCMLAALPAIGAETLAVTFGAPNSEDLRLGTRVAEKGGVQHRVLPLERGYVAHGAEAVVWLAEGRKRCFHARQLALSRLRAEAGARAVMMGFAGDDVLRMAPAPQAAPGEEAFVAAVHRARAQCVTDPLLEEVLAPGFRAELRGAARDGVREALGALDGDRQARFAALRYYAADGVPTLFADDLDCRDPYTDPGLIDFATGLPYRLRLGGVLQRAFLRRLPELASVRSPKDGVSPAVTGVRERLARWEERARRAGTRRVERVTGRGSRPGRRGIGDYAWDLRTPAGERLLSLLLEPRTLERRQLDERALRRLVERTLAGRGAHTRALGMLLTLELFQRQFLEGDFPALGNGPVGVGA